MPKNDENLVIHPYQVSDRAELLELFIGFEESEVQVDSKNIRRPFRNKEEAEKYMDQSLDDAAKMEGALLVALIGGQLAGFILFIINRHTNDNLYNLSHHSGDHGYIGELFVKPQYRGQGIAKKLIAKADKHFVDNGCVASRLLVSAGNTVARSVYEKLGYSEHEIDLYRDLR